MRSDKGFYSKDNINALFEENMNFLIAIPFTSKLSYEILDMVRDEIEDPDNAITIKGATVMGVCKEIQWDENHSVYAEIFFNPIKAANAKAELYSECTNLKPIVAENPKPYYDTLLNEQTREQIKKCKDPKEKLVLENQLRYVDPKEIKVNISEVRSLFKIEEIIEGEQYRVTTDKKLTDEKLKSSGWLIILSNQRKEPSEVLSAYRDKDIELNRLRVYGNEAVHAKMFVGFIASILMCYINNVMSAKDLHVRTYEEVAGAAYSRNKGKETIVSLH